jgi:hypothetical protein
VPTSPAKTPVATLPPTLRVPAVWLKTADPPYPRKDEPLTADVPPLWLTTPVPPAPRNSWTLFRLPVPDRL